MQRPLRPITNPVTGFAIRVADGWNAFWYTPVDPTLLGVIRILAGLMLLYTHAVWGLALDDFFGPDAWIDRKLVDVVMTSQRDVSGPFRLFAVVVHPAAVDLAGLCRHDGRPGSVSRSACGRASRRFCRSWS